MYSGHPDAVSFWRPVGVSERVGAVSHPCHSRVRALLELGYVRNKAIPHTR